MSRKPVALVALAAFLASLTPARASWAEDANPESREPQKTPEIPETPAADSATRQEESPRTVRGEQQDLSSQAASAPTPAAPDVEPVGGDKTGVSSQAISVPQGPGKAQGMGESFSTQLSTGVANFAVPLSLVPARGAAQPSLSLSYSSAAGHGVAGVGWDVGVSFIARQIDRGVPQYADPAGGWQPTQDRFVYNGGQELVPIGLVTGASCPGALPGEVMPAWASGWQYFRPRVEGSFLRFFWSPDHHTWRVQSKAGTTLELGVPQDGSGYTGALEQDPTGARTFRWNLAREYDAYTDAAGRPENPVVYRYLQDGGMAYLSDVYDTPPAANVGAPLSAYAHHAHLLYQARPDATFSYRRGWQVTQAQRLVGVDVTSASFAASGPRELVRRYHLAYDPAYHLSLLASVQAEGRCASPVTEDSTGALPASTGCPTLPPMAFGYQHVAPYDTAGNPSTADVPGWEGFDERIHTMASSPDHSLDEALTDLFDVNADGLPDVMVTAPYLYGGNDAVFLNGRGGSGAAPDTFSAAQCLTVQGVPGEDTNVVRLDNANVAALDLDGDGVVDLVNMPEVKSYSVYSPVPPPGGVAPAPPSASGCWAWQGRSIATASQQNPKIDFQDYNQNIKVMDVNGDGLVDVVFSSGTEYQTFFSLGRYPGGDGQFGAASWTGPASASISNDPVTSCLPWDATPPMLGDADVSVADMNGDGLPDIVRIRPGDVRYWPGRGNGYWGTGDPSNCPGGTFDQDHDVVMTTSPEIGVVASTESLRMDDVNGDGLDDLVKVEQSTVYVWLNVDGAGWAGPHIIRNAPPRVPSVDRVRLVDINGSGTRDILYGNGNGYVYMDVNGAARPWVLTHVANGLGKTTDVQYGTSTEQMVAAAAAGTPWTSVAPMPIEVVTQVTDRDNLSLVGQPGGVYVTQYTYANPVYDGRQREFRGFSSTTATRVGDANSPTGVSTSTFLLGQCVNDEGLSPDPCSAPGRWEDNPREALKGLPRVTETSDGAGTYASTAHHTYRLRKLYTGLDGREVRYAFESQADSYAYDTGPFTAGPQATTLTDVELETTPGTVTTDTTESLTLRAAAGRAHLHRSAAVDLFGNATAATDDGCVDGCAAADESIVSSSVPQLVPGDASGWMWRTVESYVSGSAAPGKRRDTFLQYDHGGSPTLVSAVLQGTAPLERFHEDASAQVAPPPRAASHDGLVLVSAQTYDALGRMQQQTAPNGRCRQVTYDPAFDELPTSETVFVGSVAVPPGQTPPACGGVALTASATYDRAFGVVTQVTDVHNERTSALYDGFGRMTSLSKPDPAAVGQVSAAPSLLVAYCLPGDPAPCPVASGAPYSLVHTQTQDGPDASTASYRDSWGFVDGLGRTVVTLDQADPGAGDAGQWVVSGLTSYDAKGAAQRAYLAWFWNGTPAQFPLSVTPPSAYGRQRYDAFGRQLQTFGLDGAVTLQSVYHALSVDRWDAADLQPGPHQGTPASVTQDGHGRTITVTERVHGPGGIEQHDTRTTYLSTGEPRSVQRVLVGAGAQPDAHAMTYDTLGRMVGNYEPDTANAAHDWVYAYDDNGDLVGTSDARGCGANYAYDVGGRIVAEDFSPCLVSQQPYSTPNLATGDGTEAFYEYDTLDADDGAVPGFAIDASLLAGRLVAVADRGAKTVTRYDGRGRVLGAARRLAAPGVPSDTLSARYAAHWFVQSTAYDGADRPVASTTGVDVPEMLDANGQSVVTTSYSKRGAVRSVGSGYGALVSSVTRAADGLVQGIVYGDLAATTTSFTYDTRRRLSTVQTYRGPPALWSQPPASYAPPTPDAGPTTLQLLLQDASFAYDAVDNPVTLRDDRNPAEWPAGAQPVTRTLQYDDLYRVTHIAYAYPDGSDPWTSPFAAEDQGAAGDPRRAKPAPHVSFDQRVQSQSFQYDWLGNTTATDDDAHGFYDRSLGTVTNGGAFGGAYQMVAAQGSASSPRGGLLTAAYDVTGNLTSLAVTRAGPCLPGSASCAQRFVYEWDEVGRLVDARRWDGVSGSASDPVPLDAASAELRYAYDASDQRTLKTAVVAALNGGDAQTAYVFGSLELRGSTWDGADYARTNATEVGYLDAHGVRLGRLHYALESEPALASGQLHVLLELPDHLGSTSIVVDHDTSELVEAATYLPYGADESTYRPSRWASFREDYGFTGKEQDVELGLTYFGKRYLATALGRWASADPLAVHGLGADANVYAYVHGALLAATDPVGLAASVEAPSSLAAPGDDSVAVDASPQGTARADITTRNDPLAAPNGSPEDTAPVGTWQPHPAPESEPGIDVPATSSWEYGAQYPREHYHNPVAQDVAGQGNWRGAELLDRGQVCLFCHVVVVRGAGNDDTSVPTRSRGLEDTVSQATATFIFAAAGAALESLPAARVPLGEELPAVCQCFAADTQVLAEDGLRAITEVREGDLLWAQDPDTGERALRRITRRYVTPDKPLVEIDVEDDPGTTETIRATPGHPFWVDGEGWIAAEDLAPGQELTTAEGSRVRVVGGHSGATRETVYNFEVEGWHTYFVGAAEALVHNGCTASPLCEGAAKGEGTLLNRAGEPYPTVLHPGTGQPIPEPPAGLTKVPIAERVPWGAQERGAFIKTWYDQGLPTPEGGWAAHDIHHIIPREYGGTNAFENLVPVVRSVHQNEFNPWWMGY